MKVHVRYDPPPFENGSVNASTDLASLTGVRLIRQGEKSEMPRPKRSRFALVTLFNRCARRDRKRRRLAMIEKKRRKR